MTPQAIEKPRFAEANGASPSLARKARQIKRNELDQRADSGSEMAP
jgi:hypothetical protein